MVQKRIPQISALWLGLGLTVVVLGLGHALATRAYGQKMVVNEELTSFTAENNSGQDANDFHVILKGVSPNEVGHFWTGEAPGHPGSYPNAAVTATGDGCKITWTGSTTADGSHGRFGFGIDGDANITGGYLAWTQDGTEIETSADITTLWDFKYTPHDPNDPNTPDPNEACVRANIENTYDEPMWVKRRVVMLDTVVTLEDLEPGGSVWQQTTWIDSTPILLDPCDSISYDFTPEPNTQSAVMGYHVYPDDFGTPGPIKLTYLNAATLAPSHSLSVTVNKINYGTVTFDPDRLDDPNADPNDPSALRRYVVGTEVALTAVPEPGKSLNKWLIYDPNYPGDGNYATEDTNTVLYLTMDEDYEVRAKFKCGSGVGQVLPLLVAAGICALFARRVRRRR